MPYSAKKSSITNQPRRCIFHTSLTALTIRDARIPFFNIRILSVSVKNYPYPYPIRSDVVNCYPYPIRIRSNDCKSKKSSPTFSTVASTLVVRLLANMNSFTNCTKKEITSLITHQSRLTYLSIASITRYSITCNPWCLCLLCLMFTIENKSKNKTLNKIQT